MARHASRKTHDPSYTELVMEWDTTEKVLQGKRSSDPVDSTHLWKGTLLSNLEPGEHTIEIEATDMFGKKHQSSTKYRIEK